ncbi:TonB-dependent receptor [Desulfosarcina ovata]|nr:TonB-dependent receptor [Desulfosarcina ovata]
MQRFKSAWGYCLLCIVGGMVWGSYGFAQDDQSELIQLEAITVTAEKQEEEVQKVPSAITVFTETALEDAGLNEIGDVIRQVPNMTFGETFLGKSPIFRGLRASQFTSKTPVVMYVDGIPFDNSYNFYADLSNIERIEVLRGAQGALYGRNSIGGIINVISKKPDNSVDAKITAEYAENETYMTKAYANGPIIKDRLFAGLSGSWSQTEGFMDNTYPGEDTFDDNESWGAKAHFSWLPTERTTVAFHADANHLSNDNGSIIRSDEVRYYDIRDPDDKAETDAANLAMNVTHEWDSIEFHSVSTFGESEYQYRQNINYYAAADKWIGFFDTKITLFTQEFRFQSKDADGGIKWLGGVFYSNENEDIIESSSIMNSLATIGYNTKGSRNGELVSDAMSIFGQTTIPLAYRIKLTAGLRYEHINKDLDIDYVKTRVDTGALLASSNLALEDDWAAFLPKGTLSWNIRENTMVYFGVSKGYLPGGLNAQASDKDTAKFDEQTSIDYEIGAKTQWLDNRLTINVAMFYMDIEDMHVYSMPAPSVWVASNAGSATSRGIEVEARARPLKGLDITAQFGWIDAEYDEYEGYEGNKTQGTPEYTINLAAQYRHASGLFGRAEMQGNGETYYNDGNTDSQDSFEVYNLKIGYEASRWDLYFYCKNILDEEYFSYGRSCGIGTLKEVGDPRTFGVVASVNF